MLKDERHTNAHTNIEADTPIRITCQQVRATHSHKHTHTIIQAHPHTRVCPMQCTLGLNGCGMDCAEILDLIHCRPKRAQNYSFFPFDQTHTPDTQSIKIRLVHRSVCGMKWIHNVLNGNTLREKERETESGTTQHFQFLSEA